jgi:membrane protease subunit (stomatin/prohibitin family)
MKSYSNNQEYNQLFWGTRMPATVMIGSDIVEVRARGNYSLIVKDPQKLQEQVPDPDDLESYLGSFLSLYVMEFIGELSCAVSNVAQLTMVTDQTCTALRAKLEPKLNELGLELKAVRIEAIEKI